MLGGTMFGYYSMGSDIMEREPMITMMIEITMAIMGCLMKNLDMCYMQVEMWNISEACVRLRG